MEKRINQRKQRYEEFKTNLARAFAILLCVVLLVFLLNLADMSTRRMMMCEDDRYAMAISLQEDSKLRLDIAGEKYTINLGPAAKVTDYVISGSKRCCEELVKFIQDKF